MKIAIFTYGSFNTEYGGQCKLLKDGLNKNNIQTIELESEAKKSLLRIIFFFLGLRSGLMFTGFCYKSNIPKNLVTSSFLISFAQIIPWNLFFFLVKYKIKIIYWNDMSIEKVTDIYVKGSFWKKIVIYIFKIQRSFLDYKIIGTNKYQFKDYKNISIVPRIVDDCFYRTEHKKYKNSSWNLVLIGNDFSRKKFANIIFFTKDLFEKIDLDFKIYVIGKDSVFLKKNLNKNLIFLGQLKKEKISEFLNKLKFFFTISISQNEGAPISLLEVQASGGFSLCTINNGGKQYVPKDCVFENKNQLTRILLKLIHNINFRIYIKKKIFVKLKKHTDNYIANQIVTSVRYNRL